MKNLPPTMATHFSLLGYRVKDKITGFIGVAETLCFDLYGCIQILIRPAIQKGQTELPDARWFDVRRITILSKNRVMETPDFEAGSIAEGRQGCADKPAR